MIGALLMLSTAALAQCELDLSRPPDPELRQMSLEVHGQVLSTSLLQLSDTTRALRDCGYADTARLIEKWKHGRLRVTPVNAVWIGLQIAAVGVVNGVFPSTSNQIWWPHPGATWPWDARDKIESSLTADWAAHEANATATPNP